MTIPCAIIRYYAALARDLRTDEIRDAVSFPGHTVVRREPAGVAAVVASWSYPLILAFCQLAPALAAGCTVVLKAELLANHPGVDVVAVAGPTPVSRRIAALCGQTLKPVTLELGGKSAAIVLDDADLDTIAPDLAELCFANSGQACFTMSRLLAPRARYADIVAALAGQASEFVVGDPLGTHMTMGPLACPRQRDAVESCVATGLSEGARVAAGGRRPATLVRGYFYEPTVLSDVTSATAIARDEVCGPVVTVIPYDDEREAVAIANDSRYGLAGSVWTTDPERGMTIARRARVGSFGVNAYIPDIGAPWGGRKASGFGTIYGPEGLSSYLATKCVFLPAQAGAQAAAQAAADPAAAPS